MFNRGLGSSDEDASVEERADKLLYFFPTSRSIQEKVNTLELLESMIDFGALMDVGHDPVHLVRLANVEYSLLQVEEHVWLAIGVSGKDKDNEHEHDVDDSTGEGSVSSNLASRLYRSLVASTVDDQHHSWPKPARRESLRKVLESVHRGLVFVSGPIGSNRNGESLVSYRKYLRRIVPYLLTPVNFESLHCACAHVVDGLEHLAVDRQMFLGVQSFVENFHQEFALKVFPELIVQRKYLVFHSNLLVWTNLDQFSTTKTVFDFFSTMSYNRLLGEGADGGFPRLGAFDSSALRDDQGAQSRNTAPWVYLEETWLRILCLQKKKSLLVFFVHQSDASPMRASADLEQSITDIIGQIKSSQVPYEFERLNDLIEDNVKKLHKAETQSNTASSANNNNINNNNLGGGLLDFSSRRPLESAFVYMNETNLVVKASAKFQSWARIQRMSRFQDLHTLPLAVLEAFDLVRDRLIQDGGYYCTVVNGEWCVAGLRSGTRELYRFSSLITTSPSAQEVIPALANMKSELSRLLDTHFGNVIMV